MLRKYLLLLFTVLLSVSFLQGQYLEVSYIADINTINGAALSGPNRLIFNADTAIFLHDNYPTENEYKVDGTVVHNTIGDEYGYPVLTIKSQDLQRSKEQYFAGKSTYILEGNIPDIDWEIQAEVIEKNGLQQQKAIGVYGGRQYTVWFAPELPYPFGPHRLGGLPGLIIRAESSDGYVSYAFRGLRKLDDYPSNVFEMGDANILSYEGLKLYIIKKLVRSESLSTGMIVITADDPAENYTIEKNRWHIISDYKKERGY